VAIYMKYGSIKGDATHAGFDGWINVIHFEWLIDWQIANRAAVQGNTRDARRPKIGEFTIKKEADGASTDLLAAICTSNKPETCTITFVRTGGIDIPLIGLFIPDKYVEYQFNAALITHFDTNAGLGEAERPIETFKFNFTEFKLDVWSLEKENMRQPPKSFGPYSVPEDKPASGHPHGGSR
jgi:type VI secretion system secreted protein Hcp